MIGEHSGFLKQSKIEIILIFKYIFFPNFQGSTLRKRKMYEEFLSKVSILGKYDKFLAVTSTWTDREYYMCFVILYFVAALLFFIYYFALYCIAVLFIILLTPCQ